DLLGRPMHQRGIETEVAFMAAHLQAAAADGLEVAAHQEVHLVAGLREARAVVAAHRARTHDGDARHQRTSSTTLPVARRSASRCMACAYSSSGKVRETSGRRRPCAYQVSSSRIASCTTRGRCARNWPRLKPSAAASLTSRWFAGICGTLPL